ncbi:hypothetical protein NHX12_034031 [Muraenolepis orangiensis]|uniref:Uncharacterized protein n=1 Tax=Muraenolepis orangiensis TaxID=630683 RepID=A0A9Q0E2X2_9TELE|nr:hypothetical protein NHX12_034031 [Muraenolepis orangiensis]
MITLRPKQQLFPSGLKAQTTSEGLGSHPSRDKRYSEDGLVGPHKAWGPHKYLGPHKALGLHNTRPGDKSGVLTTQGLGSSQGLWSPQGLGLSLESS